MPHRLWLKAFPSHISCRIQLPCGTIFFFNASKWYWLGLLIPNLKQSKSSNKIICYNFILRKSIFKHDVNQIAKWIISFLCTLVVRKLETKSLVLHNFINNPTIFNFLRRTLWLGSGAGMRSQHSHKAIVWPPSNSIFGGKFRLVSEYFILCRTLQDLNSCTQVHNLNECKLLMFMRYISIRIIYTQSYVPLDHAHRPSHPPILRCVR